MKKLLVLFLSLLLSTSAFLFVGCGYVDNGEAEKSVVTIAMPDGAPVLAAYKLLKNVENLHGHPVKYKIVSGVTEIATGIAKGEVDIAVMPVNVAAKFYNKGTDIKLLSVNVFGCLYMVGKTPLSNGAEDLKGKVLVNIGQGASPDITMKLILDSNDIPYEVSSNPIDGKVALRYVSAAPEAIALLASGKADYAVLGEPAATNATKKLGANIVMDLQDVWNGIVGENSFTQAGVVVAKSVYNDNGLIRLLLKELEGNKEYILQDSENVLATIQEKGSALNATFDENVLGRCNLGCRRASVIKTAIENYFTAVYEYDPTFIGGKLPDDGFYYM